MESQDVQNSKKDEANPPTENLSEQKNQENISSNIDQVPAGDPLQENDQKILGKKVKRSENKKLNRELCSICRDGGNLLLCDNCPRSFHIECLKIKEENIPEGKWYCPMCAPTIQKKL